MQCGMGWCGHRQLGPLLLSATGPLSPTTSSTAAASQGALDESPTLGVFKFASCDGCQLTLLDCEDELLTIAGQVQIATYLEALGRSSVGPTTCRS